MAAAPRASPRRRWLRGIVVAVVALEVFYLIAANLFLNTSLAPWAINRKPEKILVEWDGGWTVVPGLARLRGIRLRGQQRAIQWYAELEAVTVWSRLLPLAGKNFEARRVRGQGLEFRFRRRLEPGESADASTPPIPGLDNPPRVAPEKLYPPPPKDREPWTIELRDVAIEKVSELWLERFRFAGDGRIGGDFRFEIRGPLSVDRAVVELEGDVSAGGEPVTRRLEMKIDARLDPFMPREQDELEMLRFLSARVRLASPDTRFGFLDHYFRGANWFSLAGRGRLSADASVERGRLLSGSRLDADEASFDLDYLDYRAQGDGWVKGRVQDEGGELTAVLEVVLETFALGQQGAPAAHVRGTDLAVRVESSAPDLTAQRPDFDVALELPPSEIVDVAYYNAFLPPGTGLRLLSGEGTIGGFLELSTAERSGSGEIRLEGRRLVGSFDDLEVVGDLVLVSRLAGADPEARRFDLSGSRLELRRVAIVRPGGEKDAGDWWADVDLQEGVVRWTDPVDLDARILARVRDSRPVLAIVARKKALLRWMKPLLRIEDLELAAGLRFAGDTVELEDLVLTGDGLEVRADLGFAERGPRGFLFVKRGPLSAALEIEDGERDWQLFGSRRWYEEKTAAAER